MQLLYLYFCRVLLWYIQLQGDSLLQVCISTLVLLSRQCPANTKHFYNLHTMLDKRRRRWVGVVLMLYKCFVSAG